MRRHGAGPATGGGPTRQHDRGAAATGRAGGREGFVLVAVLWLLVALGAVGIHASLELRSERLAAANTLDAHRSRAAAIAGTEYARSRLTAAVLDQAEELRAEVEARARTDRQRERSRTMSVQRLFRELHPVDDPWRDPGGLVLGEMALGDALFTLDLRDTGAALHLNTADAEMLQDFFSQGLDLDYALAGRLAQAILDWREPEMPEVGAAQREGYLQAGAALLPPHRPFSSLDELRHVLGMTPEIFEAVRPHLTLVGSGQINVNAAPAPVLTAIPGVDRALAAEIVRLRESGHFITGTEELFALMGREPESEARNILFSRTSLRLRRPVFRTHEVEIVSEGRVQGGVLVSRVRAVVSLSDEGALLVWREVE